MSLATFLIIVTCAIGVVLIFGILTIKDICVDFFDAKEDASISTTAINIYKSDNSTNPEDLAEKAYRISRILHGYPPE